MSGSSKSCVQSHSEAKRYIGQLLYKGPDKLKDLTFLIVNMVVISDLLHCTSLGPDSNEAKKLSLGIMIIYKFKFLSKVPK